MLSFPPWNDQNHAGEKSGFEIDLLPMICERAKLKCEIGQQDMPTIISSVRFKKHDALMGGMLSTPKRRKVIDFTEPYGQSSSVFFTLNNKTFDYCKGCGNLLNLDDPKDWKTFSHAIKTQMKDKKVVVVSKSINHNVFQEHRDLLKSVKLIRVNTPSELMQALEGGQADVAFIPRSFPTFAIKHQGKPYKVLTPRLTGNELGKGVAFGLRKTDKELNQQLSKAIQELKSEGVLSKLSIKWFEYDMFADSP